MKSKKSKFFKSKSLTINGAEWQIRNFWKGWQNFQTFFLRWKMIPASIHTCIEMVFQRLAYPMQLARTARVHWIIANVLHINTESEIMELISLLFFFLHSIHIIIIMLTNLLIYGYWFWHRCFTYDTLSPNRFGLISQYIGIGRRHTNQWPVLYIYIYRFIGMHENFIGLFGNTRGTCSSWRCLMLGAHDSEE